MSLSPDGRWFAVTGEGKLMVIAVADGTRRALLDANILDSAQWTPDSRSLVVSRALPTNTSETLLVPVDGGVPRQLDFDVPGLRIHPDGRSIVYAAGEDRGEIWALEHFLSSLTGR